jgi:hypothetical protein
MPVYLCKPGVNSLDPWRHGIPVYVQPFPLRGATGVSNSLDKDADVNVRTRENGEATATDDVHTTNTGPTRPWTLSETAATSAIRTIRHSEVILVDDVVYQYSNYWLRLRWPGSNGGFAGYVCLVAHTNAIQLTAEGGPKIKDTREWVLAGKRCLVLFMLCCCSSLVAIACLNAASMHKLSRPKSCQPD